MRLLGLDIGEKRIGVAVSDPDGTIATPLEVLDARSLGRDPAPLVALVQDYEPAALVVGLPVTLAGEEGGQAASVREVAGRLAAVVGLPLIFVDERLSSAQARRAMRDAGVTERSGRGAVDKVAAAILLQSYLDARQDREDDGR